ncbi:hypothetical protein Tco_0542436, partial [Tanacetum coccineum]
ELISKDEDKDEKNHEINCERPQMMIFCNKSYKYECLLSTVLAKYGFYLHLALRGKKPEEKDAMEKQTGVVHAYAFTLCSGLASAWLYFFGEKGELILIFQQAAPPPTLEAEPKEEAAPVKPTREAKHEGRRQWLGMYTFRNGETQSGHRQNGVLDVPSSQSAIYPVPPVVVYHSKVFNVIQEMDIRQKDEKSSQNEQNQAWNGNSGKSQSQNVKVNQKVNTEKSESNTKPKIYSKECAEGVMNSLGLSIEKIQKCMGDPEADVDNEVLKDEQDSQVGKGSRANVTILPTLIINDVEYRGPTATLGQATTLPHVFTAGTLHDPAPVAWNMDTSASSHLNNSITSLSENFNTCKWLKFNNRDFTLETRKEFKKRLTEIRIKEIECPEGLNFEEFGSLYDGIALQNLDQFCHVSYEQDDRCFVSQAWNRLFRINEQVVREYVMEFLSSFTFRDHIKELEEVDIMEMNNNLFQPFYESCYRSRPINYNPKQYVINITTRANYDTRHPPLYTLIQNPIRRLVHHLLTLSVAGRHSGKEKVTLDDLFLLHSMDGGVSVDVPCHVAKFFSDKAKGSKRKSPIVGAHLFGKIDSYYGLKTLVALMNVTLGPETSSMSVAKLVDLGICRYNGLGISEIVAEIPEVAGDDVVRVGQAKIGGVGRHPNISNANRLRVMDEKLGEIVNDVDDLTYVVSGMSEQYDQFYREFRQWL